MVASARGLAPKITPNGKRRQMQGTPVSVRAQQNVSLQSPLQRLRGLIETGNVERVANDAVPLFVEYVQNPISELTKTDVSRDLENSACSVLHFIAGVLENEDVDIIYYNTAVVPISIDWRQALAVGIRLQSASSARLQNHALKFNQSLVNAIVRANMNAFKELLQLLSVFVCQLATMCRYEIESTAHIDFLLGITKDGTEAAVFVTEANKQVTLETCLSLVSHSCQSVPGSISWLFESGGCNREEFPEGYFLLLKQISHQYEDLLSLDTSTLSTLVLSIGEFLSEPTSRMSYDDASNMIQFFAKGRALRPRALDAAARLVVSSSVMSSARPSEITDLVRYALIGRAYIAMRGESMYLADAVRRGIEDLLGRPSDQAQVLHSILCQVLVVELLQHDCTKGHVSLPLLQSVYEAMRPSHLPSFEFENAAQVLCNVPTYFLEKDIHTWRSLTINMPSNDRLRKGNTLKSLSIAPEDGFKGIMDEVAGFWNKTNRTQRDWYVHGTLLTSTWMFWGDSQVCRQVAGSFATYTNTIFNLSLKEQYPSVHPVERPREVIDEHFREKIGSAVNRFLQLVPSSDTMLQMPSIQETALALLRVVKSSEPYVLNFDLSEDYMFWALQNADHHHEQLSHLILESTARAAKDRDLFRVRELLNLPQPSSREGVAQSLAIFDAARSHWTNLSSSYDVRMIIIEGLASLAHIGTEWFDELLTLPGLIAFILDEYKNGDQNMWDSIRAIMPTLVFAVWSSRETTYELSEFIAIATQCITDCVTVDEKMVQALHFVSMGQSILAYFVDAVDGLFRPPDEWLTLLHSLLEVCFCDRLLVSETARRGMQAFFRKAKIAQKFDVSEIEDNVIEHYVRAVVDKDDSTPLQDWDAMVDKRLNHLADVFFNSNVTELVRSKISILLSVAVRLRSHDMIVILSEYYDTKNDTIELVRNQSHAIVLHVLCKGGADETSQTQLSNTLEFLVHEANSEEDPIDLRKLLERKQTPLYVLWATMVGKSYVSNESLDEQYDAMMFRTLDAINELLDPDMTGSRYKLLQQAVLGCLTDLNNRFVRPDTSIWERKCAIASVIRLLEVVPDHNHLVAIAPKVILLLRSALEDADLVSLACRGWMVFINKLPDDGIGAMSPVIIAIFLLETEGWITSTYRQACSGESNDSRIQLLKSTFNDVARILLYEKRVFVKEYYSKIVYLPESLKDYRKSVHASGGAIDVPGERCPDPGVWRSLCHAISHDSDAVRRLSLEVLLRLVNRWGQDLLLRAPKGDTRSRSSVSWIVQGLVQAVTDSVEKCRQLALRCLGTLGAIDPGLLSEGALRSNRQVHLSRGIEIAITAEHDEFVISLIRDYLYKALISAQQISKQDRFAFAIQRLLSLLSLRETPDLDRNEVWRSFSREIQRTIRPFLRSKYGLSGKVPPTLSFPYFRSTRVKFETWLANFSRYLIGKLESGKAKDVMDACWGAINADSALAMHLLPYIMWNILTNEDQPDVAREIIEEFKAIGEMYLTDEDAGRRADLDQCVFTMFATLDELHRIFQQQARILHKPSATGPFRDLPAGRIDGLWTTEPLAPYLQRVSEFRQSIDPHWMARVAIKAQSFVRALYYFEEGLSWVTGQTKRNPIVKDPSSALDRFAEKKTTWASISSETTMALQHAIFTGVGDPDGVAGAAAMRPTTTIDQAAQDYKVAGDWARAVTCYEQAYLNSAAAENLDDAQRLASGLVESLLTVGSINLADLHMEGILTRQPDWKKNFLPYQINASWRLGNWEQLNRHVNQGMDILCASFIGSALGDLAAQASRSAIATSPTGVQYHLLGASADVPESFTFDLLIGSCIDRLTPTLIDGSSTERYSRMARIAGVTDAADCDVQKLFVGPCESIIARTIAGQNLGSGARGNSYQQNYNEWAKLHFLDDLRNWFAVVSNRDNDEPGRFHDVVHHLDVRVASMSKSFNIVEPVLSLKKSMVEVAYGHGTISEDKRNEYFSQTLVQMARSARKLKLYHTANAKILEAAAYGDAATLQVETAKVYDAWGDTYKALAILEETAQRYYIPGLSQTSREGLESTEVTTNQKALMLFAKWTQKTGHDSTKVIEAYEKVQTYAKNNGNVKGESKAWYLLAGFYDTLADVEGREVNRTMEIIRAYYMSARLDDRYMHQALPRLVTLWLDANLEGNYDDSQNDQMNNTVALEVIPRIPDYQWLVVTSNLISRMTQPSSQQVWSSLRTVIVRLLHRFPHQIMWSLLGAMKSKNKNRTVRFKEIYAEATRPTKSSSKDKEHSSFAKTTIDPKRLEKLVTNYALFADELITMANYKPQSDVSTFNVNKEFRKLVRMMPVEVIVPTTQSLYPEVGRNLSYDGYPTITGVRDEVQVLASLAKPKKFSVCGSDGKVYTFLCKPKDDLRKDQRMMELNRLINRLLVQHEPSRTRQLQISTYAVVPVNEDTGIIEWVQDTSHLRSMITSAYKTANITTLSHKQVYSLFTEKTQRGRMSNYDFYYKLLLPRFPPILHQWFIGNFQDPSIWYSARLAYARSTAAMCIVGWIVGLGDRHTENILYCKRTGRCLHVDWNCLFLKGGELRVPEVVPFRLTRQVVDGLGPTGIEGGFRKSCEETYRVLRRERQALMIVMKSFVHDPTLDLKGSRNVKKINDIDMRLQGKKSERALPLSVEAQVNTLIDEATDLRKLCEMYIGWAPYL
eukprot:Clim_evm97s128 gene=Clim_evmTU97s128